MSSSPLLHQANKRPLPRMDPRWVGVLTSEQPIDLTTSDCQFIAGEGRAKKLFLRHELNSAPPSFAERLGRGVIFDGILYDRPRWERELSEVPVHHTANDAEVVLAAYEKWGEQFFSRLRGTFALVIWDSRNETLMCLRDPTGVYSLFYSEA